MKRLLCALCVILLLCTGVFSPAVVMAQDGEGPGAAAGLDSAGGIRMEVSCGFNNAAKQGRYLPAHVTLTLEDGAAVPETSVLLCFLVRESDGEVCRYEYTVDPASHSGETVTYYIPLGARTSEIEVVLEEEGTELIRKKVSFENSMEGLQSLIGVFTTEPDRMNWLNGVTFGDGTLTSSLVWLDEETAPVSELAYDALDMIIVSDFQFTALSGKQLEAILKFVENGGVLLFGGGENYLSSIGAFADRILETPYPAPQLRMVNMGPEYAEESPEDSMLELWCADIPLKNGVTLLPGENYPLLSGRSEGEGRIAAAGFSLSDISSFAGIHPEFAAKFLSETFGEAALNRLKTDSEIGNAINFTRVQNLVGTGDAGRLPNVQLYAAILMLYLIVVGPGIYLMLRAKRQQVLYLVAAALLSLFFVVVIYAMGFRTRFSGPFYTSARILEVREKSRREEVYLNARSPYNRPYQTMLAAGYEVRPLTDPYGGYGSGTGTDQEVLGIRYTENGPELRIGSSSAFTSHFFHLTKTSGTEETEVLTGEVAVNRNQVSGSVTSHYPEVLRNALLLLDGRAVLLGDLEPEMTIDLSQAQILNCPVGNTEVVAACLTGATETDPGRRALDDGYLLALERSRLLGFSMEQSRQSYRDGAVFAAFLEEGEEKNILREDILLGTADKRDLTMNGMTLFTSVLPADYEGGGETYSSALREMPRVLDGVYDYENNRMYAEEAGDSLTLEYSLGNELAVAGLDFLQVSELFTQSEDRSVPVFDGSMYFFNYNESRYDLMKIRTGYTAQELEPYLSPSNTLMVRYTANGEAADGAYLPVPWTVGK